METERWIETRKDITEEVNREGEKKKKVKTLTGNRSSFQNDIKDENVYFNIFFLLYLK